MRLRQKMFWGSAFLAVLPVVVTIYFVNGTAADIGTQALQAVAQSHITSVRDAKKQQIEDYFKLVTDQVRFFSREPTTLQMMKGFRQSFPEFIREAAGSGDGFGEGPPDPGAEEAEGLPLDQFREELDAYYNDVFAEEYQLLNIDPMDNMASKLDLLDDNAVALQYYYIAVNPNPLGTKEEYLGATDQSSYTRLHRKYHPILTDFMTRFVFSDIYLVDVETGNIVYSATKGIDFATSLREGGPYVESSTKPGEKSGIATVFAEAEAAVSADVVSLVDFAPYLPNYNDQAAFISSPIFDGEKKIGVAIFQLPIDKINDIMTYNRAWRIDESGETGETLILASDFTMRNDSRAFVEEKEEFMRTLEGIGVVEGIISNVELKDTTVGLIEIKNFTTENAFTGTGLAGFELIEQDYRGKEVFWAYAPINVAGLSWIVISSLDYDESLKQLKSLTTGIQTASYPIGGAILVFGGLLGFLFSRQIARPIAHMEEVVVRVSEGDFTARADIKSKDELATLAMAFNGLLDDRLTQLAKAEKENEMLNNSIIELLKASFQLSQRDLTVQVPVTEDVTGPLADAINQMATETSKVLLNVRKLAEDVAEATRQVKLQSDNVSKVAETERTVVATTMSELAAAAEAMNKIAEVAQSCNEIAAEATRTTQIALETVTGTVNGMGEIRETIHETEKRIKRLGERSQEISGIVDIINNIAERTHVLALNASMQAAAAGDAGRGFSVVADEVQRLAESSRNATSQISALVKNIQVETNDTIATMDKTIGQVVEGSRLAERAGEQMKETQDTTANLVKVVEQIAMASQQQARISNELREHALSIQSSTEETARQLDEQAIQTDRLVEYSRQLIESIRVFKLPG